MYITLESDYAVRIVAELCANKEQKLDAKTISERSCITLRFALKILRKLVSAGIIQSSKGTRGGYKIKMDPHDITLRMVLEATEGTYYFSRCLAPDSICSRGMSGKCCFQKAFGDITNTVRKKLEEYNFADLLAEINECQKENADAVSQEEKGAESSHE